MEENKIDFENTISFLFAQVTTAHRNRLEKKMDEIGLHSGQVFILFELWKEDELTQIRLANNLNLAPPTVNRMLKGLQDNGFVVCGKDEDDARSTRARLTRKGVEIRAAIEDQWIELEEETLANLSEIDKLILLQLLGNMRRNFFGKKGRTTPE
jgi:DNA-binding MarR family transcriptional regulator